jgi:hypothetical protein
VCAPTHIDSQLTYNDLLFFPVPCKTKTVTVPVQLIDFFFESSVVLLVFRTQDLLYDGVLYVRIEAENKYTGFF